MSRQSLPPEYPLPSDLKKVLDSLDNTNNNGVMSARSQVYSNILKLWKKAKCIEPTENHYLQLLKFALYLEEYQCEKDTKRYELTDKTIDNVKLDSVQLFIVDIKNEWVDGEKPLIKPNTIIKIMDTSDNKSYSLCVVQVTETLIKMSSDTKFLEKYCRRKRYNIQFSYPNYPIRCNHYALWLTYQNAITAYLFPDKSKGLLNITTTTTITSDQTYRNIEFFNSTIKTNHEQVQAVTKILHKSSFPYPYILYGPPGTGKTATIIESICQVIVQNTTNNILVCTPSNTAADEIAKRLLDYIRPNFVYRIYSGTKDPLTIDEKILPCCNCENGTIITFLKRNEIEKKRIVIVTLCSSLKLILIKLRKNHFSHVIIDEAGQSIEPDILIPVNLVSGYGRLYSQIVLAGDPKQLGPVVISKLAEIVLGRSILERLMSNPIYQRNHNGTYNSKYITKLLVNYRSHPKIIQVSNKLFYNDELIAKFEVRQRQFPVVFYNVLGKEEKDANSTSSRNPDEADIVLRTIVALINNSERYGLDGISAKDIGVVTPFSLQSKHIKTRLIKRHLKDVNVGTVELFQGQERKIIIISTVRSKIFGYGEDRHIGSLSNPKRFNVAVTRAKNMLIVIGNSNALQNDASWRYIMRYCIANNSCHGQRLALKSPNTGSLARSFATPEITRSTNLFRMQLFKINPPDDLDSLIDAKEKPPVSLRPGVNRTLPTIQPMAMPSRINTSFVPIQREEKKWCTIL